MMMPLRLMLCFWLAAALVAADRFALVIGSSGEARSASLGLAGAGFDVERCWRDDEIASACARWLVRLQRGNALGVLYYDGPATPEARTAHLGGIDGVDVGQLVRQIAAAPHAAALVALDATSGDWSMLPAPAGSAVLLRPRPGGVPGRRLADHLVERLLVPGVPASQALAEIRRRDPALSIDSKLPPDLVLAADPGSEPPATREAVHRELERLYLAAMRRDFELASTQNERDEVPAHLKARAWVGFLTTFRYDAPGDDEDEDLRRQAVQALVALGRDNPTAGILSPPPLPLDGGLSDPLPDMRWMVDRAVRLQTSPNPDRDQCIQAWTLVLRLFPDDDPSTHNDDIWRVLAATALRELGAPWIELRPVRPIPIAAAQPQESRTTTLLGISVTEHSQGLPGLSITTCEARTALLGLAVGDRLLSADGLPLVRQRDLESSLQAAEASGSLTLITSDPRRLHLRLPRNPSDPVEVSRISGMGLIPDGGTNERLELPTWEVPWIIACEAGADLIFTVDGQPVRNRTPTEGGILAVIDRAKVLQLTRSTPHGGPWAWSATPMSLCGRRSQLHAGNGWSDTVRVAAAVGETLWIEVAAAAEITCEGTAPNGARLWAEALPRQGDQPWRQVIITAGRADRTAPQAIAQAGLVQVTVRALHAIDTQATWRVGRSQPWAWR